MYVFLNKDALHLLSHNAMKFQLDNYTQKCFHLFGFPIQQKTKHYHW